MTERRVFLNSMAALTAAGICWPDELRAEVDQIHSDKHGPLLPTRPLGNTGEAITMLGLGRQHFRRLPKEDQEPAIELAIEGGIRFFDTANAYGKNSLSERLFGQLLTPKYRDEIYLMTKSGARTAEQARRHLENSLRAMKTDVIDLWQIHTIENVQDVDRRWDNGVVDVFIKAQEEGKVRHIGFFGHKEPKVNLHMLKHLKSRDIKIQASQFPVNVCDPDYASFIKEVVPICLDRKIAILGMKTMCGGRMFGGTGEGWGPRGKVSTDPVIPTHLSFREATDYVWTLPIATRIAGYDNLKQLQENIDAARSAEELSKKRRAEILKIAAEHSGPNREYYKRNLFDQDNPREKRF